MQYPGVHVVWYARGTSNNKKRC